MFIVGAAAAAAMMLRTDMRWQSAKSMCVNLTHIWMLLLLLLMLVLCGYHHFVLVAAGMLQSVRATNRWRSTENVIRRDNFFPIKIEFVFLEKGNKSNEKEMERAQIKITATEIIIFFFSSN